MLFSVLRVGKGVISEEDLSHRFGEKVIKMGIIYMYYLICLSCLLNIINCRNTEKEETDILTKMFFINLLENPKVKDYSFNEQVKHFIDKQVDNYVNLMQELKYDSDLHLLSKRSIPTTDTMNIFTREEIGVEILEGFVPILSIGTQYPVDIKLFNSNYNGTENWYAVSLERERTNNSHDLIVYKFVGTKFVKIQTLKKQNGYKLSVHTTPLFTIIVAIVNEEVNNNILQKSGVYIFNEDEKLHEIQNLGTQFASDASMWTQEGELYLAISQEKSLNQKSEIDFEADNLVYHWKGGHFDLIQKIRTNSAQKVVPFSIWNSHFLIIANNRNNKGEIEIFSEIYKYDDESSQFLIQQRILTHGVKDIKHFCFSQANKKEDFVIIANSNYSDGTTNSIIFKYMEDYFLPFQNINATGEIKEWLPVVGENSSFALLAVTENHGITAFQYNGWNFVEAEIEYSGSAFNREIATVSSYNIDGKPIIVVANKNDNGHMMNIFEPIFTYNNMLHDFYNEMFQWCQKKLNVLQNNKQSFNRKTRESDNESEKDEDKIKDNSRIIEQIQIEIEKNKEMMDELENIVENSVKKFESNVISGHLFVDKVTLVQENNSLKSLTSNTINNVDVVSLLNNIINLKDDFSTTLLSIKSLQIENDMKMEFINDHKAEELINTANENFVNNLTILGNVLFENGIEIKELLNKLKFEKDTVLLTEGDQIFNGYLEAEIIETENLTVQELNGVDITKSELRNLSNDIKEIHINNFLIDEFINNNSIDYINMNALKLTGNQNINASYSFEHLFVDNLEVNHIGNVKIPEDLLLINGEDYELNKNNIEFINNLTVNQLIVEESFNDIPVFEGKLDVVLVDSDEEQKIKGYKTFENIELLSPIDLQGQIDNRGVSIMNPVLRIEDDLVLENDYIISGNVSVESFLSAENILDQDEAYSLNDLIENGLTLDSERIPVHLNFKQPIKMKEIFADKINNRFVSSFVTTGSLEPQVISGWKIIHNNVIITGNSTLVNVNGVNLSDFEDDVLKTTGDQIITGSHHINSVVANRIQSENTYLGKQPMNILTDIDEGTLILNGSRIKINNLEADQLFIKNGTINGYDFDAIVNDTVFLNQPTPIIVGHKTFKSLSVEKLFTQTGMEQSRVSNMIEQENDLYELPDNIKLPRLQIKNVIVKESFNKIPANQLDSLLSTKRRIQVLGDVKFEKLTFYGKAFIEDDFINNVSISRMYEDSVKIDEPHEFKSVNFVNGFESRKSLLVNGEFLGIDLQTFVLNDNINKMLIREKNFLGEFIVHGNLFFNGLVSGINFTNLCSYSQMPMMGHGKDLIIEGNVIFLSKLEVNHINGFNLQHLITDIHQINKRSVLFPQNNFETIIFEGAVILDQRINNIDIQAVADNYFSKTKDQYITGDITFNDGVIFQSDVSAQEAVVLGEVYGLKFDKIRELFLLNGEEQLFATRLAIKSCKITELHGDEFSLNGHNLETDVMRYDKNNFITGKKTINNLFTERARIEKNINIQNVDVLKWLENSVLKKGTFKIGGKTIFRSTASFINGLSVGKLVNGIKLNKATVLRKTSSQKVLGKKIFLNSSNDLHFSTLNVNGFWNKLNAKDLFENLIHQTENMEFHSPINFYKTITTKNVNLKTYQGIDVNGLLENITKFSDVVTNEKYDKLFNLSIKAKQSLSNKAFYLNYLKVIQVFPETKYAFPVKSFSSENYLFVVGSNSGDSALNLFGFNENTNNFDKDLGEVVFDRQITFIKSLQFGNSSSIYTEFSDVPLKNQILNEDEQGKVYTLTNSNKFDFKYLLNGTDVLDVKPISYQNSQEKCLLLVKTNKFAVYCEKEDNDLSLEYEIKNSAIVAVESLQINDFVVFIILKDRKLVAEKKGAEIEILKYYNGNVQILQNIYIVEPCSISAIRFKNSYYFAVVSQKVKNAQYPGTVHIRRFDVKTQLFQKFQDILLQSPFQIKFAILPSEELVLYVLTKTPTQSLIVFAYNGIIGFEEKIIASTIPNLQSIDYFSTTKKHYIYGQSDKTTLLIEAKFIGSK